MWIKASERKPNTSRRVLIRGISAKHEDLIGYGQWFDFDNRWSPIMVISDTYWASGPEIAYWMEINNLLSLPIEGAPVADSEIDVPVQPESIKRDILAGEMFETLRGWCDLWDTIEEWVQNAVYDHARGDRLHLLSMISRKAYMRLEFGDRVDRDLIYKDVPNEFRLKDLKDEN